MVFDYIARQKISGTGMTYFIVKQIACPTPGTFTRATSWQSDRTLAEWVIPYVLELSYTSWRLRPYAQEMGDDGPPFRWDPERRSLLRADLDAAMLHVYGLTRVEAEHVLDSFPVVRKVRGARPRRVPNPTPCPRGLRSHDRSCRSWWIRLDAPSGSPAGKGPRHARDSRLA